MTDPTLLTVAAALAGDVQIGDDAAWSALQDVVAAKPQVAAELAQAREQRGSATSIDSVRATVTGGVRRGCRLRRPVVRRVDDGRPWPANATGA